MMGFEPLVNQRLLPPTFPRYAKIIKREEMVHYFSKLIDRIKAVCEVVNLTNLHCILVSMNISYLQQKIRSQSVTCKKNLSIYTYCFSLEKKVGCMYVSFGNSHFCVQFFFFFFPDSVSSNLHMYLLHKITLHTCLFKYEIP